MLKFSVEKWPRHSLINYLSKTLHPDLLVLFSPGGVASIVLFRIFGLIVVLCDIATVVLTDCDFFATIFAVFINLSPKTLLISTSL